jgi:hypothetical protein
MEDGETEIEAAGVLGALVAVMTAYRDRFTCARVVFEPDNA